MKKRTGVLIKNIYYMLTYAFSVLREKAYENMGTEEFENIYNLFAAILSKGIAVQLKQGLYREYVDRTEAIPVVRGRILIGNTLKERAASRNVMVCEYDEMSENNMLNQILKSTVLLLLGRDDVDRRYKDELKKEMLMFASVDTVDLSEVRWNRIRFHRNSRTYQMLMAVCQLVAEGCLMNEDGGEQKLASFVDDQRMSRLYEKFLLEYYRKEFAERIKGFTAKSARIEWQLDDDNNALLPSMQTDIMLSYGERILIIDAKFYNSMTQKNYGVHSIHSGNLYQIFTYVKNKENELKDIPHNVSGMLLYGRTGEEVQPDNVYHMSGNRIEVKSLDLNCDFSEIRSQLDGIVEEYFGLE